MKNCTRTNCALRLAAAGLLMCALVQSHADALAQAHAAAPHHTVVPADAVKWGPAPASLPPGAQVAVLLGSPAKEGPFVLRLKFPAGFVVPPHRHSKDEFVTVISGRFAIASGEKAERAALKPLPPGSFVHLPAGTPHYAWAAEDCVIQVNGNGPFDVVYVDPKDDPRQK
jgi:quercetin dioxygenase-like cupin family protein